MVLPLFGNYVFAFFEKSVSYAGFEVRKIILLCIRNTKLLTMLSNHDNQINKMKITTIVILHSSQPNSGIRYASISDSSKVESLGLFSVSFWITDCKHSHCEMPCHKCLWNQMNRCKVVSCRNNIVWIPIIVVLLTIITFTFWKPCFPVTFLP